MVTPQRLPGNAYQPQIARDTNGSQHLIALVGDAAAAQLVYHAVQGDGSLGPAITLTREVLGVGTVRGPQVALADGKLHLLWMGSANALPRAAAGSMPLLYATAPIGEPLAEPIELSAHTQHLDGGLAIAAHAATVTVMWHANPPSAEGEAKRLVFMRQSTDGGASFSDPKPVSQPGSGACACCGMTAAASDTGMITLFRSAEAGGNQRNMTALIWNKANRPPKQITIGPWPANTCMMSSAAALSTASGWLITWEQQGAIEAALLPSRGKNISLSIPPNPTKKHPRIAMNKDGTICLAWTEGTGWNQGGTIHWQLFNQQGQPIPDSNGSLGGLAAWGTPAIALNGKGFVIFY